jgi:hypothetical protein
LVPPNLKVGGRQLWVHGYQFPESNDSDDGNWLRITAHCGHLGASVWASGSIIQVTDLARWAKQCDALVRGRTDAAELSPLEPELAVKIVRIDSLGHFEMTVSITPSHLNQEHTFRALQEVVWVRGSG